MLRKSIEPETKVWNVDFGFGTFKSWNEFDNNAANIKFEFGTISVLRKLLTEIESEYFNPPV